MEKLLKLSNERDIPLLRFLWDWKLAPTLALAVRFFPKTSPRVAYNRLNQLRLGRYIGFRTDLRGQNPVWVLDKKGFAAIRDTLPLLREEGYKTEQVYHDRIVTAVHLGNWLLNQPLGAETFTEQQLRRYHSEEFPEWVPASDRHRCDGYWRIRKGDRFKTVALEVELSRKTNDDYQTIGAFYADTQTVDQVLWIVPNQNTAVRIHKQLAQSSAERSKIHCFSTLKDFRSQGWQAPVISTSSKPKMIEDLLSPDSHESQGKLAVNASCAHTATLLLDTRKTAVEVGSCVQEA